MKEIVKSKRQSILPTGIYAGVIGGWKVRILSQDYYGKVLDLELGIKATGLVVIVVVQNNVAYCYDKGISLS